MRDERFKTQLFRFVDVFPTLHDSHAVSDHLQSYFKEVIMPSRILRWSFSTAGRGRLPRQAAAMVVGRGMRSMARRLIAGRDAGEALPVLERLWRSGSAFTLDVLGEACLSEAEAEAYGLRYLDSLRALSGAVGSWPPNPRLDRDPWGQVPRVNVSLKTSSLYSQIDPMDPQGSTTAILAALRPILRSAKERGAFLSLDLEMSALRDLTYQVFARLLREDEFRDYPHVGVGVQAYLRDSESVLSGLRDLVHERGTPINVRLVKGAYWDYETVLAHQEHWPVPVFVHKMDSDAQFEHLTRFLVDNSESLHPALGTHNVRSMAYGLAYARDRGLPDNALELQVLHGMADPVRTAAVSLGVRVREYVPVGELIPGMGYLVRRLLENTANESFLRHTFTEHDSHARLLAPPRPSPEYAMTSHAEELRPSQATSPHESPLGPATSQELPPFQNEPHADFSKEWARDAMLSALDTVRAGLGSHHPLLIDGKSIETGHVSISVDPAHPGTVVGTVAAAGSAEVDAALAAARVAFPAWRDTTPRERATILLRAGSLMRDRRFELAALEVIEAGKPWREADGDVTEAIDFIEYYSREMLRLASPRSLSDVPGERDFYFYEPRGVAAVIAPWNFPLAIPVGMTSAALVAGNSVVFKPANPTPVLGAQMVRILHEAGVPKGALNFLPGPGGVVGAALVRDRRTDLIAFTGSLEVGLSILREAANVQPGQRNIKKVVAEMGGKNAIIVDSDADLDAAVEGVVISAFHYAGQKCSACSRAIVLEPVYDLFLERLVAAAASLRVGDPADPGMRVGPVITAEARDRILEYIEKGKNEARLVLGTPATGGPGDGDPAGYFVRPHIFAEVPPEAVIAQEEIFGPVLAVSKAHDFDQALSLAIGVRYGLTGGLFSRDPEHIKRAYAEFRVGNLYINRKITGAMVGRQPFGGSRMSGVGSKAGGPDYLLQFLEPRTVTENTLRRGFAPPEGFEPA